MKEIPLSQGQFAIVDDDDFDLVSQFKWSAMRRELKNGYVMFYAFRVVWGKGQHTQQKIFLHRFLMNPPKGMIVDHINRNPLDCRRENMRIATMQQNRFNSYCGNPTGLKGVFHYKHRKYPYKSVLIHNGKRYFFGPFATKEEAARAYDEKAKEVFGEFAYLNFPEHTNGF